MSGLRIAAVAGEASGDLLAAPVLQALRQHHPGIEMVGIGGPRMQAAGLQAWWPSDRLAVNGYGDVLRRLPELLHIRGTLRRRLLAKSPAVFVGVDAPDFNLSLERRLRAAGIPVVHMVSPSIWAWRRERIQIIRQAVDHMLCVFPFEPAAYADTGVKASYIGHPLAQIIPQQPDQTGARQQLGLPEQGQVLAVLPGSRAGEVRLLAEPFIAAAAELHCRHPLAAAVVPVAHPDLRPALQAAAQRHPELPLRLIDGQSHAVLAACDLALVASGTATLECALFKRPMVIGYRVSALSAWMMRGRNYLPDIGLPNILAGQRLVPELVQEDCTAPALAAALSGWIEQPTRAQALRARFAEMHRELTRDTVRLAAEAIVAAARA